MPAANFPCLTILLFYRTKPFMIFGQFGVFFPKKPTTENWSFLKIHFPAVKVPLCVCVCMWVCVYVWCACMGVCVHVRQLQRPRLSGKMRKTYISEQVNDGLLRT